VYFSLLTQETIRLQTGRKCGENGVIPDDEEWACSFASDGPRYTHGVEVEELFFYN